MLITETGYNNYKYFSTYEGQGPKRDAGKVKNAFFHAATGSGNRAGKDQNRLNSVKHLYNTARKQYEADI